MPKAPTVAVTKTAVTKSKMPSITKPATKSAKPAEKDSKPKKAAKESKARLDRCQDDKKEKDPNAPKRPRAAYILFCADHRAAAKEEAENNKDIMRVLGDKWKALSDKDKAPYTAKSEKDKQRYEREMKAYNAKSGKENRSEDTD
ncbi:HMG-box [Calocera viscosa TUFC12733]|uniref:HMG-box n=1 Tax=Calocera viscosa (strain TUFC12733) TaxID=1330018 RepID=A0A167P4F4_CALVF|nr:HMG-box [Calocera viscosa TUFC12733]